jgi:DNA-directed RNA polymerase specialized sigma24 family protein
METPSMTSETLLQAADQAIYHHTGRYLTDLQKAILRGSLQGERYRETSIGLQKSEETLKNEASRLWRSLSNALGEKVTKSNFREAIHRHHQRTGRRDSQSLDAS